MAFLKGLMLFMVALTMALALSVTLTMNGITQQDHGPTISDNKMDDKALPSKRVSRFLATNNDVTVRNPNAADHCHKDHEVCYLLEGKNSTCCNNKCVDLHYDNKNCGACKNKCKFTQTCCRGQCVELAFDKRHCGACNHRCEKGEFCVYGMCNYA
ncbi:stigma-specific STIG1-like protein 1 [Neltuma alba]|uniref:stigma-specific STIG1-like protein 1 n=1 Tax=Neltuma alba TaxID=207710 RepID=UPI0010A45DB8|nr:stigma-specific STIG1-like protein 1 [Prosopis alba]